MTAAEAKCLASLAAGREGEALTQGEGFPEKMASLLGLAEQEGSGYSPVCACLLWPLKVRAAVDQDSKRAPLLP